MFLHGQQFRKGSYWEKIMDTHNFLSRCSHYQQHMSVSKFRHYLKQRYGCPMFLLDEKAKVMDAISQSKGGVDEAGLLLLDLVDKSNDNMKPRLIGKLFVACAFCEITTQQFLRLSTVINNLFVDDLLKLKEVYEHNAISDQLKSIYTANGLMEISIKKPEKFSQGYSMSELGGAIFDQGLELEYSLTGDGKLLAEICFDTKEEAGNTLEKFLE